MADFNEFIDSLISSRFGLDQLREELHAPQREIRTLTHTEIADLYALHFPDAKDRKQRWNT